MNSLNHIYQQAMYYVKYNWITSHGTLTKRNGTRTTPAMEAGLTDRPWMWEEFLDMADAMKPRKYKYKEHIRPKARERNERRRQEQEEATRQALLSKGVATVEPPPTVVRVIRSADSQPPPIIRGS